MSFSEYNALKITLFQVLASSSSHPPFICATSSIIPLIFRTKMLRGIMFLSPLTLLVLLCSNKSTLASTFDEPSVDNHHLVHARAVSANQVITTCRNPNSFAMTFDDGPYIYQNNISDYLISRGIHGTFFVNGYNYDCIYEENIVASLRHSKSSKVFILTVSHYLCLTVLYV